MEANVKFGDCSYGKTGIKILYVNNQRSMHHIYELEVSTILKLESKKEFERGDNSDVIPTDTIKNLVYVLAKKFGIRVAEEFGMTMSQWILDHYPWVRQVTIDIKQNPWKRIQKNGKQHVHAFIDSPEAQKVCKVQQVRGQHPEVTSGLNGLRLLKTTQSGFEGFNKCEFTSLPESDNRILSSVISASWTYRTVANVDFDRNWNIIKDCIINGFSGCPDRGTYSASVQKTVFDTEKIILRQIPEIKNIIIDFPNVHYFNYDFSRLPAFRNQKDNTVFVPQVKPSGMITGELINLPRSKL